MRPVQLTICTEGCDTDALRVVVEILEQVVGALYEEWHERVDAPRLMADLDELRLVFDK